MEKAQGTHSPLPLSPPPLHRTDELGSALTGKLFAPHNTSPARLDLARPVQLPPSAEDRGGHPCSRRKQGNKWPSRGSCTQIPSMHTHTH